MLAYRSYNLLILRRAALLLTLIGVLGIYGCNKSQSNSSSSSTEDTGVSNGSSESTENDGTKTGTSEKILIPNDEDENDQFTTEEGAAVASDVAGAYLNLPAGITPVGPSVSIYAKGVITPGQLTLEVSIPLDSGDGMSLTTTEPENLVVMYQIETADGKTVFGVIPRSELKVEVDQVTFTWLGNGNYQAASLAETVDEAKKSSPVSVPVLTIAKESALPEITWNVPVGTFTAAPRQVTVAATILPATLGIVSCVAILDEDKSSPYDLNASAGTAPQHVFAIAKETAHTVYGRLQCIDTYGRVTTSAWSAAIAVAVIPAPTWSSTAGSVDALDSQPFSVTLAATGAASFSLTTNEMDCDTAGSWSTALSVNATSGVISGTPTSVGTTCTVKATATNVGGSISQSFVVTIWADPGNICDSVVGATCTVSSTKNLSDLSLVNLTGNLVVASGGIIQTASMDALVIKAGGNVTVQAGGQIKGGQIKIKATNVTVDSGGSINSDGISSYTGATTDLIYNNGNTGQGAPHGGNGGQDSSGVNPVASAYGIADQPSTLGAKGEDGASDGIGGLGAGSIKIVAASTLTVDGNLSANGTFGTSGLTGGGGGSGGSIWLVSNTFAGTGAVTANGGNGGDGSISNGAGGAGGRIASYHTTKTFGTPLALGGIQGGGGGASAFDGLPGSLAEPASAAPGHEIYVSSATYNGNLGGLQGADANCQAVAATAALSGRWKALLSGGGVAAKERLMINGSVSNRAAVAVASSGTGLWSGTLVAAVDKDENGASAADFTWTGSLGSGVSSASNCANWTDSTAGVSGIIGDYVSVTSSWLNHDIRTCNQLQSLYCVSQ